MSAAGPTIEVWDGAVRVIHWSLVLAVACAWVTTAWLGRWHEPVGYLALGLVAARLVWGFAGTRYARFTQFVRGPRATWRYTRAWLAHREPRFIGHNPLGGWMVIAIVACIAGLAVSGWLYRTERYWGDETVEACHLVLAWTLLGLVFLHVIGVVFTSRRHRENLVRAMLDGRKAAPHRDDVA